MGRIAQLDAGWGIAVVRIMMGIILVYAGFQKFAGGLGGTAGFFTGVGIPAAGVMAPFVATLELVGGILLIVGLGARWLGLLFMVEFIVTAFVVKLPRQGWDASRIDLMLLAGGVMLLLAGAGKLAVDEWLARRKAEPRPDESRPEVVGGVVVTR